MNRQPGLKANNPYERISELELKLNRANRYIRRLRQDNQDLRKQLSSVPSREGKQTQLLEREVELLPQKQPRRRRRRPEKPIGPPKGDKPLGTRQIDEAKGFSLRRSRAKRPQLRLAAMAVALAAISIITLSSVIRLFARRPAEAQNTNSQSVTANAFTVAVSNEPAELPDSPLQAPDYNTWAQAATLSKPYPQLSQDNAAPEYNSTTPPDLKPSSDLQKIVDEMVNMAVDKSRPTKELSISLIDVKTGEVAGYQQQELLYPASVLKMFWMVYVYGALNQGILADEEVLKGDIYRMIQHSSNEAASRLIDTVTGTESGKKLEGDAYQEWRSQRWNLSEFFRKARYEGIIVSQKTYSALKEPKGREGQMWDEKPPVRNKITSEHGARLMYEIVKGKAVSPEYSQKMLQWLTRDLSPQALADKTRYGGFNPIDGFLGKSLPADIDFASKAGWSSSGRHEVAFVRTRDGKVAYILSIMASDRDYSNDWGLFPAWSRYVFDQMNER